MARARSMILDMLKTPQQVRQEQLTGITEQALGMQAQIPRGTTAIPGMITNLANQQLVRTSQGMAEMPRRLAGAAGQFAGMAGATPETQQAIRGLGLTGEELGAQTRQQIMSELNPSDPRSLRAVAKRLQEQGLTQAAMLLIQQAAELEKNQAETLAAMRKAGKTDLKEVKEGNEIVTYRLNADGSQTEVARAPRFEAKAPTTRNRVEGDETIVEQWNATTQSFEEVSRGPRYQPTDPAEIAAAVYKGSQEQMVDKQAMTYYIDSYAKNNQAVQSARQTFTTTDQMRTLLDSGILTGALSDVALPVAKLLVQLGAIDSATVKNTEQFIKTSARQTVALLASGVFGTAQSITDNDRKFAEGMAGGDTTLTADTIRTLIDINEYYATLAFEQQQRGVNQAYKAFPDSDRVKQVFQPMYYDGQIFDYPILDEQGRPTGQMGSKQWDERTQSFIDI